MASKVPLKSMLGHLRQSRPFASVAGSTAQSAGHHNKYSVTGEFAPVYIVFGMVTIAVTIGLHTAKQQLRHSPGVNLTKKRRESMFEVENPDVVVANADKFINKSFLRKVAHIQEDTRTLADPSRPDPFTRPRTAETLKTVGVNPRKV